MHVKTEYVVLPLNRAVTHTSVARHIHKYLLELESKFQQSKFMVWVSEGVYMCVCMGKGEAGGQSF